MGFLKYARAQVLRPDFNRENWSHVRTAAAHKASLNENLVVQAEDILKKPFNPDNFLLTHATIVASVDTESIPNVKLGSVLADGQRINRPYGDYRVTKETEDLFNNNNDAFERQLLLKAFPTFVGGHNFVEHVQIEEQSKGRLLDAVARDIGRSVYIDLLIATDRQHEELIRSIESGRMSTLSMGCLTQFTLCSKCGHLAKDEPDLCHHIRYQKGSTYYDHNGVSRRIGELCGHHSYDDTGGVQFIEASWVETPAFVGAVLRNTIEPTQISGEISKQAAEILNEPPKEWITNPQDAVQKVAFFDDKEDKEGDKEEKKEKKPEKVPLKELEQDVYDHTIDSVRKRIKQDLEKEKSDTHFNKPIKTNNNLSKEGSEQTQIGRFLSASNKREAIGVLYRLSKVGEMAPLSHQALLASIRVGSIDRYSSSTDFQKACRDALGRDPKASELDELLFLGTLLSYREKGK